MVITYVRISRVIFVELDEKGVMARKLLRHFLGADICSRGVHRLCFRKINGDGWFFRHVYQSEGFGKCQSLEVHIIQAGFCTVTHTMLALGPVGWSWGRPDIADPIRTCLSERWGVRVVSCLFPVYSPFEAV